MASHFRSEIAGLRAIAVISVVLFHLEINGFQGGFIGVDVFFVISGYLITRNILLDLNAGKFSFGQFYVRRTRRIYPALIFTVVATYLFGALWASTEMLRGLAKESTHALLSISNIQYWRESHQYFAPNSDELALLHCWSLSLEEQFYLLWPILIGLAWKLGRTFGVIAIAAVASFLCSILITRSDPLAAFFLMPFRIFEFAIGASVLFLETRFRLGGAAAESVSAGGLLCVVASALLVKSDTPHLDVAILLPCLGAAATIWAGDKTRASRVVANRAMVVIGTISYSLYLCHWPILYFARFLFGDGASSPMGILSSVVVMAAMATAMNFFVERKFIQPSESSQPVSVLNNAIVFWSVVLTLAAITHVTFLSNGFAWRLPKAQRELAYLQGFPSSDDLEPTGEPLGLALVGDSHAEQYIDGLGLITKPLNVGIDILTGRGCPMLLDVTLKGLYRERCLSWRNETLERLEHTNLPVVFAQRWEIYNDATVNFAFDQANMAVDGDTMAKLQLAIERTVAKIGAHGRHILIIGDQVKASCVVNTRRLQQGPLPHTAVTPCPPTEREVAERSTAPINQMLARIQAKWPDQIEVLRPVDYFCDMECPVVNDGIWLYWSQTHLSVAGSRYIVTRAADVFRKFLTK